MSYPGHPLTFTKGDRRKGIAPKPILPKPEEVAMLRRVAAGYATLTYSEHGPQYAYDDGTPMPLRRSHKDPNGEQAFQRLVANGWLIPESDGLFAGTPAQTYRARKPM